jgi:hypothetical protein
MSELVTVDGYGADLLDRVTDYVGRFVAIPSPGALVAFVLWAAHAHALDAFESTPRIAFVSPEPGSGKTRCLEVMQCLVPRPKASVNATPAALFRLVGTEGARPTVLYDELDALFGPKAHGNEDVRAFLNAGHRRGGKFIRCVGEGTKQDVVEFPAFCAVALAGLHDLPDTIGSRSVIVRMRRKAPDDRVEPFRIREHEPIGHELRNELAEWTADIFKELEEARPLMPSGVTDRPADVWEALLAVADAAGGHWPATARAACVELTSSDSQEPTFGVRLLSDVRQVWVDAGDPVNMSTEQILQRLNALDDAPWAELRGAPLNPRGLARILKPYGVTPRSVRLGDDSAKGYRREDLADPWKRYLPPLEVRHLGHDRHFAGIPSDVTAVTDVTQFRQGQDTDLLFDTVAP